jgi:glutamate---cysteine ligase / carboxylate-amine ligase
MTPLMKKIFGVFDRKGVAGDDAVSVISSQLIFQQSQALTLGVECEFGLLDPATFAPAHAGFEIAKDLNHPGVQHELYQHMIEITTGVCATVQQAERDLNDRLNLVQSQLPRHGAVMAGAGSLPLLMPGQTRPVETERYAMLRRTRRAIYERFTTLGMHIHIGMSSPASCIRYHNFYLHFMPHLLALSANSPFEQGRYTGFASFRPTVTESMPVGGLPYQFRNWQDYVDLCRAMARAGSITDLKDLWWDLRPCPRYGTLEIRICDQPSTLAEAAAIAAFVHSLGHWFSEHEDWLEEMPRPHNWRLRENKWRAMRYGLDADIVIHDAGDTRPMAEDFLVWLERLRPVYDRLGYARYRESLMRILERGNGAARQLRVWQETRRVEAVCDHLVGELLQGRPAWEHAEDRPPAEALLEIA